VLYSWGRVIFSTEYWQYCYEAVKRPNKKRKEKKKKKVGDEHPREGSPPLVMVALTIAQLREPSFHGEVQSTLEVWPRV